MSFPFTASFPFGLPVLSEVPSGQEGRFVAVSLDTCKSLLNLTAATLQARGSWTMRHADTGTTVCVFHESEDADFPEGTLQSSWGGAHAPKCFPLCGTPSHSLSEASRGVYVEPGGSRQYYTDPPPPPDHCPPDVTTDLTVSLVLFDLTMRFYRTSDGYRVSIFLSGILGAGLDQHFYMFTGDQSAWEDDLYPPSATWASAGSSSLNGVSLTGIYETPTSDDPTFEYTLDLTLSIL